jgi:hypothetical protein
LREPSSATARHRPIPDADDAWLLSVKQTHQAGGGTRCPLDYRKAQSLTRGLTFPLPFNERTTSFVGEGAGNGRAGRYDRVSARLLDAGQVVTRPRAQENVLVAQLRRFWKNTGAIGRIHSGIVA